MARAAGAAKPLLFLYEDDKRAEVFIQALKRAGVTLVLVNAMDSSSLRRAASVLRATGKDGGAVVFSRLSASARKRHHEAGVSQGARLLAMAERLGAVVLNGTAALRLELSKAAQAKALRAAGIHTPSIALAEGRGGLHAAASRFRGPIYVKPDCGGSGLGVKRFDSGAAFVNVTKVRANLDYELADSPPGDLWVVQGEVPGARPVELTVQTKTRKRHVGMLKTVYRLELIGGRVHHLVRILASDKTTALCPCDRKNHPDVKFTVVRAEDEFRGSATMPVWRDFTAACEAVAASHGLFAAAFEFVPDERTGVPSVYDVNTNTNYAPAKQAVRDGVLDCEPPVALAQALYRVCNGGEQRRRSTPVAGVRSARPEYDAKAFLADGTGPGDGSSLPTVGDARGRAPHMGRSKGTHGSAGRTGDRRGRGGARRADGDRHAATHADHLPRLPLGRGTGPASGRRGRRGHGGRPF